MGFNVTKKFARRFSSAATKIFTGPNAKPDYLSQINTSYILYGARVSVVGSLCYKPDYRGFNSR